IIPGARVTLIAADGKKRNAVANASGDFSIPNLPPGVYTLTIEFKGFRAYIKDGLQIPTDAPLKIVLTVAPVNAETEVKAETGGVSVEPDQNLSAIVLDERMIMDLLPDNEDDMRDFLEALAGPAAGGGGKFYIDGFPNGRLPPRETILQIRINQNPFSAEYSHPGAGRIEIVTKPGNEQWRGSLGFSLGNSALNARRANATTKPDLDQRRYSFTLSGPIISKKMSFFSNGENRAVNSENTINARTLNGPLIANAPSQTENRFFGMRTGYLINQKNTLNAGFNHQQSQRESNGGDFTLPDRGAMFSNTNQTLTISETFLIHSRLIHEIRLRYQREISNQTAKTSGVAINIPDAFSGGGDPCCPN
ncbi:MAG: carboxypeptidase regulatory-like domain-containing protein, partial [Blastocatellia bacterium]